MIRAIALFLTVMTGFSGLVYEVVWQKYLATLLGSHSEATAAVLAIFLGGLSVGYWLFGVVTRRVVENAASAGLPPRLLLVYGLLEFSIGLYVLVFPWLFQGIQALSFAIPHGAAGFGFAIDVALTVLLIGPASVMMGGTIPILTQALSRSLDDATRFHAFIYAFNTAGAFVGAIAAGFYLIPEYGLKTVMLAMGGINLFAGSIFVAVGFRGQKVYTEETADQDTELVVHENFVTYGVIALLTGFAMMVIQTTIIRVGGLSFGSSHFTFSMVVAVFVLCIALGSFAVSALQQIPAKVVVLNQWGIGLVLWLLYTQVEKAPYAIQTLRTLVRDSEGAFVLYHGVGFLFVLIAIGLPVFLSGAALPLLFHHMRREVDHLGDLAGNLYSWNTVGSLLGALLGGYVLLFWIDLHQVYRLAIAALIIAAVLLTIRVYGWRPVTSGSVVVLLLGALALMPAWDPRLMYAGLFRMRDALPSQYEGLSKFVRNNERVFNAPFVYMIDDPVASITVREYPLGGDKFSLTIATNGKSDANSFGDFTTMGLAGSLPALLAEPAERAFVIGWGTGITVGELASLDSIKEVAVAELSPGVIEAAPLFDFVNHRAIDDPKVRVITSDAYRALMRSEGTFDVIVSEPSNAWVTGVEMLYSHEFLTAARSKLSPGGVYCQWMYQYETDDASLKLVLRTYATVFDHLAIWGTQHSDLLLMGFNDPNPGADVYRLEERFNRPDFRAAFERVGITKFAELLAHELLPMDVVRAARLTGPTHSLYHPRLSHFAGIAFFRGAKADVPFTGYAEPAKIGARRSLLRHYALQTGGTLPDEIRSATILEACKVHAHRCQSMLAEWISEGSNSPEFRETYDTIVARLRSAKENDLLGKRASVDDMNLMAELFRSTPSSLSPSSSSSSTSSSSSRVQTRAKSVSLDQANKATESFVTYYHHASPFEGKSLIDIWSRCRDTPPTAAVCRQRMGLPAQGKIASEDRAKVRTCREELEAGPDCQAGLEQARSLIESGTIPDLRTSS